MEGTDATQLRDDIRGLEIMRDRAVQTGAGENLLEAYEFVLRRNREKLEQTRVPQSARLRHLAASLGATTTCFSGVAFGNRERPATPVTAAAGFPSRVPAATPVATAGVADYLTDPRRLPVSRDVGKPPSAR